MKKTPAKRAAKRSVKIKNSGLGTPAQWFLDWASGGYVSSAGEHVNEKTALGISAYLACIKNISEDEAKLPLCLYKRMEPRGRQELPDHPVDRLIRNQPNEEMTAMTFRQTLTAHALGWHGGFAEIVRDASGVPTELWPLDPCCVQVMRETSEPRRLFYWVTYSPAFMDPAGPGQAFMPRDIFHIHGLGYNGVTGYVMSRLASDPFGNALASQKFNGAFFANGATSTGTIEVPDAMSETAFKHLRDSWAARHQGAANQHKPIILEQGAKWTPMSSDPQKSQMMEAIRYGDEAVARIFRVPPHKIGILERATNNNIEQQALEYTTDCLMGWLVRWEQEIWRKLLLPREQRRLYAKHDTNMLLRGDSAARSAFYREGFNVGYLSPNDIREYEDLNPIEGGDSYFINSAMVPLDIAAEGLNLPQNQPNSGDNQPPNQADNQPANGYAAAEHYREILGRIAATHTKTIAARIGSILQFQHDRITRPSNRNRIEEVLDSPEQKQQIAERLLPHLEALEMNLTTCRDH